MVNELLVNVVNSTLGIGKRTARGNQAYHCPKCNSTKLKLEINFDESSTHYQHFGCWVCGFKGKSILSLFKTIQAPPEKIIELRPFIKNKKQTHHLDKIENKILSLPSEFKTFQIETKDIIYKHALSYLKSRGITKYDILKYNIGYCDRGEYKNMIIIPSYDKEGKLNYFTARSFEKNSYIKYKNPDVSRDIIPFELFINWDLPIILCEGPFDAIAIKRNVIPLLGKNIQPTLMKQLIKSNVKTIYIALDQDALKQALEFCELLINEGKEVYLVEINGKDFSEIGFKESLNVLHNVVPLNFKSLLKISLTLPL
jgi:hypothetical protein